MRLPLARHVPAVDFLLHLFAHGKQTTVFRPHLMGKTAQTLPKRLCRHARSGQSPFFNKSCENRIYLQSSFFNPVRHISAPGHVAHYGIPTN